ncbi:hypothetical protein [Edaphobacter sp.]|uniref:hypothetical protein n=1 Tax=Edaphobacter sp. TaxID=1934404 RepID=UPI002DC01D02|nr:hypothetical protein [Edaphobacter sp.]HEU5341986.1 hypothetical protein [Edaphobacter sp.]
MTVTVTLWYVIGCPQCSAEVERVTRAAVRDMQVTKLTLSAGHKHNHEADAPAPAAVLEANGQQRLTVDAAAPNGFDVEGQA